MNEIDQLRHELKDHYEQDLEEFKKLHDKLDILLMRVEPMYDIFNGTSFTGRLIIGGLKILAILATAIAGIVYVKNLLK